ncbi:mannitol dehydrogenase family protein [Arthrobacter sp. B3I4]|uniref:mannitol dehydrogenase family protein n=1 Tax=Arthrobacter sp. B3I4 TaxID=3042267 RepID=UPI00278A4667|nr:mannitol dehydrogenase family protein [Arthrobacter sp. B3I4]MDQ0754643.1 fructuronate reductase [Arthrobacter sp. B3I4]
MMSAITLTDRLSLATLAPAAERPGVSGPAVNPRALSTGMVHFGVGAFHRAHQAVYTEDAAAASGDTRWGILGVTGRSAKVAEQLGPQDGLYSVLTKARDATSLRVMGSLRKVAFPGVDSEEVLRTLAAETVHLASLTITEKGYPRTPQGSLDLASPAVAADVVALKAELSGGGFAGAARTPLGLLARGLARRHATSGAPFAVVCCDNLMSNGSVTRGLVLALAEAAGAGQMLEWLDTAVTFPSTMVDRIVPATTEANRREAEGMLGLRDEALVVAEPFGQWIIEDNFKVPRPAWDRAGAVVTADVGVFEVAKLRMLNATHSLLAYLGALRGYRTIAEAVSAEGLAEEARRLQRNDIIPTLTAPPRTDLADYGESILERFANPNLGHTTIQVAMDGSQKLPVRILGTVIDRLAAGEVPQSGALLVAAWMVFVYRGRDVNGRPLVLDDPVADMLRAAAAGSEAGLADRLLAVREIFPAELADHPEFRAAVAEAVRQLLSEVP